MNRKFGSIIILALAITCGSWAESTNLNYSVAEINQSLGRSLALTNATQSAGMAEVEIERSTAATSFSSVVFNDIDLSAIVGTNSAIVLLFVHEFSGGTNSVRFRKNGETDDISEGQGSSAAKIAPNESAYFVVLTDANGVIECRNGGSINVYVEGFVRLREWGNYE